MKTADEIVLTLKVVFYVLYKFAYLFQMLILWLLLKWVTQAQVEKHDVNKIDIRTSQAPASLKIVE